MASGKHVFGVSGRAIVWETSVNLGKNNYLSGIVFLENIWLFERSFLLLERNVSCNMRAMGSISILYLFLDTIANHAWGCLD